MLRRAILGTALITLFAAGTANAASIAWSGPDGFDDATIVFAPFYADALVDITGSGIYHDHGVAGRTFTLDARVDGLWVNLWSDSDGSAGDASLAAIVTPISFAGGMVDGLRLGANPDVGAAYHCLTGFDCGFGSGVTTFHFDARVPEPASLLLFGTGIAAIARRRLRKMRNP